jgi:hypothetical protein
VQNVENVSAADDKLVRLVHRDVHHEHVQPCAERAVVLPGSSQGSWCRTTKSEPVPICEIVKSVNSFLGWNRAE